MDLLPVILTFVLAYGLFLTIAYFLARVFFPSIDADDVVKPKRERKRSWKRIVSH
ncbi:MAG TPA: hypothetical protein VKZ68_02785 [Ohtaekwangia sp.]|nr:hypothetical protein [Ohtaekwangia sp.]